MIHQYIQQPTQVFFLLGQKQMEGFFLAGAHSANGLVSRAPALALVAVSVRYVAVLVLSPSYAADCCAFWAPIAVPRWLCAQSFHVMFVLCVCIVFVYRTYECRSLVFEFDLSEKESCRSSSWMC